MRTRPLPNRHAHELSVFFESVQATLNRNRGKPDLDTMSVEEILDKVYEESWELEKDLERAKRDKAVDVQDIEHEACDLAVCALAAWMWARGRA